MKFWPLAAAALFAAETAAIACSCMNTDDPVELRRFAAEAAKDAVAMVEVETVLTFEESKGAGDRMRIVRAFSGSGLPAEFRVSRGEYPSSASCDLMFEKGQRDIVLLYAVPATPEAEPTYRISGLCTAHLLDSPYFARQSRGS